MTNTSAAANPLTMEEIRENVRASILREPSPPTRITDLADWLATVTTPPTVDLSAEDAAVEARDVERFVEKERAWLLEHKEELEYDEEEIERRVQVKRACYLQQLAWERSVSQIRSWVEEAKEEPAAMERFLDWFQENYRPPRQTPVKPDLTKMDAEQREAYEAIAARWPRVSGVLNFRTANLKAGLSLEESSHRVQKLMLTSAQETAQGWHAGEIVATREGTLLEGEELEEIKNTLHPSSTGGVSLEKFQRTYPGVTLKSVQIFNPLGQYYFVSDTGFMTSPQAYLGEK